MANSYFFVGTGLGLCMASIWYKIHSHSVLDGTLGLGLLLGQWDMWMEWDEIR